MGRGEKTPKMLHNALIIQRVAPDVNIAFSIMPLKLLFPNARA